MIEFHNIQLTDLPQLSQLYAELTGRESDLERMRVIYDRIVSNSSYHLIGAYHQGKLAGTIMGIVCLDLVKDCRPFMVVENVVVFEAYRGTGVGKRLMHHIEDIARQEGCAYIMLVSGIQRKEAHKFYEAVGYPIDKVQGFKKELGMHA